MLTTPAPASIPYYTPSDPADLATITQAIAERVTALHTLLDTPPRAKASRSSALATTNSSRSRGPSKTGTPTTWSMSALPRPE